ncbi:MAG TPA: hypothetical protein DCR97_06950 [Deltaproteobacteria bacterium]|nr:hypothetical protein [Deltaproteobacteria bacterium]
MKILIVHTMTPFQRTETDELAARLEKALIIAGHESEALRIPFQWEPPDRITSQMLMVRAFELWNVDHVIAMGFPAFLIRHPKKTLWVLGYEHGHDLIDGNGVVNRPPDGEASELRMLIRNAENESFRESRRILVGAETTRQYLLEHNQVDAKVLVPPAGGADSRGDWSPIIEVLLR